MDAKPVLLSPLRRRRWRRDLITFFDALAVCVSAGYDLAYAWPQTLDSLGEELGRDFLQYLIAPPEKAFSVFLKNLSEHYPDVEHRLWLGVVGELYQRGSAMAGVLTTLAGALKQEQERDWQAHLKALPLKISLVLALFFLPATLALVFYPLVTRFTQGLP